MPGYDPNTLQQLVECFDCHQRRQRRQQQQQPAVALADCWVLSESAPTAGAGEGTVGQTCTYDSSSYESTTLHSESLYKTHQWSTAAAAHTPATPVQQPLGNQPEHSSPQHQQAQAEEAPNYQWVAEREESFPGQGLAANLVARSERRKEAANISAMEQLLDQIERNNAGAT